VPGQNEETLVAAMNVGGVVGYSGRRCAAVASPQPSHLAMRQKGYRNLQKGSQCGRPQHRDDDWAKFGSM